MVLVVEDIHWADEMSLRLLSFVGRRISEWPALLIATAREEELAEASVARQRWRALPDLETGAARPVPALATRHGAAGPGPGARRERSPTLARVEQRIWSMSEGNPFVAVEGMHAFEQGGLAEDPSAMAMPARVRELVARRLDRLAADTRQVAAMASVIGRRFDFDLLCSASGVDGHRAAEAVEEMVRAHVLQAVGDQLDFTHERVREVAYGRLLAPRRRLLHRAVVDALEAAGAETPGAETPDAHIEPLAQHALRAELWERAVRYLRQAGVKAAARSALADARTRLEQALGALARLPESRASLEQGLEIRLELRPVLTQLGRARQTLECLREAETLAERLDDNARRGRVAAFLTNIHAMLGELDEALGTGTRALALADQLGDEKLRVLSTTFLVVTLGYRGDFERAVELAIDNLARLPADRVYADPGLAAPPSVFDRGHLVIALAELGRFADGAPHEAEAIRLAELTQHAYTMGFAYRTAAVPHLLKGDWATALSRLEPGIAALRSVPLALPIVVAGAAWALAELDRASEALDRLAEGEPMLDQQVARGLVGQSGWVYHALGRACLRLGRLDDARRLARRAVECSRRHPAFEGYARLLLGDIATRSGALDVESAEAEYRSALGLAERHGMRPLAAHCLFGLGQLRRRSGRAGHWSEHLAAAMARYREMSMRPWLGPAEPAANRRGESP